MSYILEALKKAEQQRELGRVPGIASDHDAKSAARHRWVLWVLLLAVNAVVLLMLFWSERQPERTAQAGAEAPAELPGEASPEALQPMVEPQQAPRPLPRQEPARAGQPLTVNAPEAPAKPAVDASPAPQRPPPVAPAQPLQLPVWPQVPQHIFDQVNSDLHLDVHVYSDQPQDRFVLMNLRKYHEGDALEEGPRLDEIIPDGVVLSFRGQRFRVQRQ